MNANHREITLPGGGRATVRLRLTHEQDTAVEAATLDYFDALPDEILAEMQEREGASLEDVKLAAKRTRGYGIVTRASDAMEAAQIRACTVGWEDVTDPDGHVLVWPDGLPALSPADFAALHVACLVAITEGRADPNAGAAPSATPSAEPGPIPAGPAA